MLGFPQKECNNTCKVSKSEQKSECCKIESNIDKDCCSNMDDHIHYFNHDNVSVSDTSCGYEFILQEKIYYSITTTSDFKVVYSSLRIIDPDLNSLNDSEYNYKIQFNIATKELPIYLANSNFRI